MNMLCFRCGHIWLPRKLGRPVQCPRCHSTIWDRATNPDIGDFHQAATLLNSLKRRGVFREWVIIGSVAYIFHDQPQYTRDMDVLVMADRAEDYEDVVLPALANAARQVPRTENTFLLHGVPVQVLSGNDNAFVADVVKGAVPGRIGDQRVKVASREHTILLALIRFSPDDWGRIERLLNSADATKLGRLIRKFDDAHGTLQQNLSTFAPSA